MVTPTEEVEHESLPVRDPPGPETRGRGGEGRLVFRKMQEKWTLVLRVYMLDHRV